MAKRTLKSVDLKGKVVIARVDFNVPLDEQGKVSDNSRIKAAIPTIEYILDKGAKKLILMSHLGRPEGTAVSRLKMNVVAEELALILKERVEKTDDCIGEEVKRAIALTPARVILLENLRFHPEETKGDEEFAKKLASLAEIYVNDAFGTAHRAHASTTIIAKYLPSCLGFLIEKEVNFLSRALSPETPYVVILGGAKVSDKIGVISSLMRTANTFLIGGAMAYTFLKAKGYSTGASCVELDKLGYARNLLEEAERKSVKIVLPVDHLIVSDIDRPSSKKAVDDIPDGFLGVDVGKKTVDLFKAELKDAKTVLWNGPLGIFEKEDYAQGTKALALYLATLDKASIIVGGGDSALAAKKFGVAGKVAHVSTGGGASLEFLEGKELPGIAVIPDTENN